MEEKENKSEENNDEESKEFRNKELDEKLIIDDNEQFYFCCCLCCTTKKCIIIPIISILFSISLFSLIIYYILYLPDLPDDKKNITPNQWYHVAPKNSLCSDGSQYYAPFKLGSNPKNIILFFFGGGVILNNNTASNPGNNYVSSYGKIFGFLNIFDFGIISKTKKNIFRDSTFLVIPYCTGDFHIGNKSSKYLYDNSTKEQIIYHYGYKNYRNYMNNVIKYINIENIEKLIICGSGSGGFATSFLAEDIIENYFSKINKNKITLLIDASFLISDKWEDYLNMWGTPKNITNIMINNSNNNNLVINSLTNLRKKYNDINILFDCSIKDGTLISYQNYIDRNQTDDFKMIEPDEKNITLFTQRLNNMTKSLIYPNISASVYIFSDNKNSNKFTSHSTISTSVFYSSEYENDTTVMNWLLEATNGNHVNYGLD